MWKNQQFNASHGATQNINMNQYKSPKSLNLVIEDVICCF